MDISYRGFEKASSKLPEGSLDKPFDEVVAEPAAESVPEEAVETTPEPEAPVQEETVNLPEPVVPEPEEEKVPKSRFLTMHERAVNAEKRATQLEAERSTYSARQEPVKPADDEDLKKFYLETFGDTPTAQKLYENELARLSSIENRAAERAYERILGREKEDAEIIDRRVASIDSAFEELSVVEGKEFSDDEQVALLDIVEEYSPKDKDGKLIGEYLLPLDRALEIYKMKSEPIVIAKKTQRNAVASLSGAKSEGTPSDASDADWKPGERGRWMNKI